MTYKQTIEFLFTSLPMYQRVGDIAIKKDLTNIRKLCSLLDNPHESFSTIHVAGTNGKGSTSHMLASIFQAAGKKTGLYTSPHYVDFRERIKVNGRKISKAEVTRFVNKNRKEWQAIQPSFFEITVAMAFDYFRKEQVDIAIIETGLGGRLDSTNIITPLLSVITNIGYDHMQMLGHTLAEIAGEKAGIIKKRIPVIIGERHKETEDVFRQKAASMESPMYFSFANVTIEQAGETLRTKKFRVTTKHDDNTLMIETDLNGPYQEKNIATVIEACRIWNEYYSNDSLEISTIKKGLRNVIKNTSMLGRWMVMQKNPLVLADAAHNIDGIKSIMPQLLSIKASKKHFVLGFVKEKDIKDLLALFPKDAAYYWCSPNIPRGKDVNETQSDGAELGLIGDVFGNVTEAYQNAISKAGKDDFIFVGGSSYVVGDYLAKKKPF